MSKNLFFLPALLLCWLGCSKTTEPAKIIPPAPADIIFNYQAYACSKSSGAKGDSVSVTVEGRSVTVWHYDLYSNCGAQIKVSFKTILDSLIITETDTVPVPAYCECYYPVSSRIDSLSPGKYNLVIYQHSYYWPQEWTTIYKDTIRIY